MDKGRKALDKLCTEVSDAFAHRVADVAKLIAIDDGVTDYNGAGTAAECIADDLAERAYTIISNRGPDW